MADIGGGIKAYGDALFSLAEEMGQTDAVMQDIEILGRAIEENPEYLGMLDSPALSREERLALIDGYNVLGMI